MSYTQSIPIALGAARTGLTLNAQLVDTTGANSGSAITTGFVEIGGGAYLLTASIPDGFRGAIKVYDAGAGTIFGATAINPEEAENNDAKTSTRLPTSSYTAPDNAGIAAIKAATDAYLDVAISSRLAAASYTAPANSDVAIIKAAVVAYLDATISSRMAGSSYVAPNNADVAAIKEAVNTYLDATISSRLSAAGYTAPNNADVAAIRASTDAYLDVAISSRLAAADYEAAPSATDIAGEILDAPLSGHDTAGTVGHALHLARADAAGKYQITGDTLYLYDLDGTTLLATLALSPAGGPYDARTPAE